MSLEGRAARQGKNALVKGTKMFNTTCKFRDLQAAQARESVSEGKK